MWLLRVLDLAREQATHAPRRSRTPMAPATVTVDRLDVLLLRLPEVESSSYVLKREKKLGENLEK
jgi:hypothetical protein